jgi:hypothetical protein
MSTLCLAGLIYTTDDLFQVVALSFLFSCFFGSAWYNLGRYYSQRTIWHSPAIIRSDEEIEAIWLKMFLESKERNNLYPYPEARPEDYILAEIEFFYLDDTKPSDN